MRHPIPAVAAVLVAAAVGHQPPATAADPKPVATFAEHRSPVSALAFSRDGRRLVSICQKDVRTWDPATGKELAVTRDVAGPVVALSPDGKTLAVGEATGRGSALDSLNLVDVATGKHQLSVEAYPDWDRNTRYRPTINALAFSPDGKRVAAAGSVGGKWISGGVVSIWDAATGKPLHRFDKLPTTGSAVAFSPDGKAVAAATVGIGGELPRGGEVWVWDAEKGLPLHTLVPKKPDYGEFVSSTDVAFSADGKRVAASVSGDSRGQPAGLIVPEGPVFVRVWDVSSGKAALTLAGHEKEVGRVAYSPDGKRLASAGKDRAVRVWDAATGKQVAALAFDVERIDALAFSPDGKRIAAAGGDAKKPGVVRVWACPGE